MSIALFLLAFVGGVLLTASVIRRRYEITLWIIAIAVSIWLGCNYDPQRRHASMAPDYKAYIDYRNEYKQQHNPQYRYKYVGDNMYEKVRINY
ncbi:hypothetical protein [Fibrobacter sp.]|uniref:hypothetical protein n=1 Tax=Fibrobacter sp. TaxID=35828 RepID=UPI003867FA49